MGVAVDVEIEEMLEEEVDAVEMEGVAFDNCAAFKNVSAGAGLGCTSSLL